MTEAGFYESLFVFLGVIAGYCFKVWQENKKQQVNERDFWQYIQELQKDLAALRVKNETLTLQLAKLQDELTELKKTNAELKETNLELLRSNERLQDMLKTPKGKGSRPSPP